MNRDQVYLQHILDAIERIEAYATVGREVFLASPHWQDAVIRQLEVIGEATKRLSEGIRSSHEEVPWRRIAGLRDVLIHDYMGVDLEAVLEITQRDLPGLKVDIERILSELAEDT